MALQDIVNRIPTTDRALESLGLMRAGTAPVSPQVIGAFALGVLIGAGVALLLTPVSGPELRARVQEQVNGHDAEHRQAD